MIENDSPHFSIVPAQSIAPAEVDTNEIARGDGWSILVDGGVPVLCYYSGEHGGGLRRIAITPAEVDALRGGTITLDAVLTIHHAG